MKKEKKPGNEKKGFPLSKFNYILEAVVLVVSVLLLIITFRVNGGYQRLKEISDHYIECERQATQLEISSDTLTREVRLFTNEKGKEHIDAYFAEKDSGNREYAISVIKTFFPEDSEVVKALKRALQESQNLEQTEYTAMRLTLESMGIEAGYEAASRKEIRNAEFPLGAENMTRAEKWELAKALVNGQEYYDAKDRIIGSVNQCILNMINEVKTRQDTAEHSLDLLLIQQRAWLVLFIAAAVAVITVTSAQIIRPLNRAVPYIRNDSAIPVSGAEEFRLLVKTYNRMHRINQTYRDKLAYRANHDPLTGVLNRNGMGDILHSTNLENAALLILDIDHFKQINDEHGHVMGDRVGDFTPLGINARNNDGLSFESFDLYAVLNITTISELIADYADAVVTITLGQKESDGTYTAIDDISQYLSVKLANMETLEDLVSPTFTDNGASYSVVVAKASLSDNGADITLPILRFTVKTGAALEAAGLTYGNYRVNVAVELRNGSGTVYPPSRAENFVIYSNVKVIPSFLDS